MIFGKLKNPAFIIYSEEMGLLSVDRADSLDHARRKIEAKELLAGESPGLSIDQKV
jgi:hypothetical protein